jgi:hypothetical protein
VALLIPPLCHPARRDAGQVFGLTENWFADDVNNGLKGLTPVSTFLRNKT